MSCRLFLPERLLRIQTPDRFFIHIQKVLQPLHDLFQARWIGCLIPVARKGEEEHRVCSVEVDGLEVDAIVEYLMLKVNEDGKGIGIEHACWSIEL